MHSPRPLAPAHHSRRVGYAHHRPEWRAARATTITPSKTASTFDHTQSARKNSSPVPPARSRWEKYASPGWLAYAEKYGLDLIVVTEPLDRSEQGLSRSVAWQKCLVLSQDWAARYQRIVLMDCDIAINAADAPNILDQVQPDLVGAVISGSHIQADLRPSVRSKPQAYQPASLQWQEDQDAHYQMHQLSPRPEGIIQTGVLVTSPERHRDVFRSVYESPCSVETNCYEQIPLSHALLTAGAFQQIDTRFNSVFHETAAVYYPFPSLNREPNV